MAAFGGAPEKSEEETPKIEKSEAPEEDNEEDGGVEKNDDQTTGTFTALVHLEEQESSTGEEDEDVLYTQRAKLFFYGEASLDKGTGNKSWCERGTGDMKFLKHRESNRIRALMRQDGTLKILVNHFIDPRVNVTPNVSSDKSWVWRAFDFSNGETLEEITFAIRFKDSTIANKFKDEFEKCQEENKQFIAGADSKEGQEEVDELAKDLEGAAVDEKTEKTEENS
jgi:Ran-binding protein 1